MPVSSEALPRPERSPQPPRVAVIGGGPTGLEAAVYAKQLGFRVLLFERDAQGRHGHTSLVPCHTLYFLGGEQDASW